MTIDEIGVLALRLVIAAICFLIATYIKPWAKAKAAQIEDSNLYSIIYKLCCAAQQLKERGDDYTGAELCDLVCEQLAGLGLDVDDKAQMYIEAAVLEIHSQLKKYKKTESNYDEDNRSASGLLTDE